MDHLCPNIKQFMTLFRFVHSHVDFSATQIVKTLPCYDLHSKRAKQSCSPGHLCDLISFCDAQGEAFDHQNLHMRITLGMICGNCTNISAPMQSMQAEHSVRICA